MSISDYNISASLNTSLSGIFCGANMDRSNVDNWMRQLMADIGAGVAPAVTLKGAGATGNGVANDTTPVATAIASAAGQDIATEAKNYLVTSVSNPLGSRFNGRGKLLVSYLGGTYQINSYADRNPVFIGKEYLYRLFLRIRAGGTLKGFIYGDSTVATAANGGGYAGTAGEPQILMPLMLKAKGVRNTINLTNRGVGGTKVSDMNAIPDIDTVGGTTDIFFIKYGINDAADGLSGFATNLRSKLAGIRASSSFATVDNLAIVLLGPNATFDPEHGRSSTWYEDLRGIYETAARDYQCAYFDTYAFMREVSWAATAAGSQMMDNPFANGQGVHPKEIMQSLIYGKLVDEMIGYSDLTIWDSRSLQTPTLRSSWVNFAGGTQDSYYSMDRNGVVTIYGNLKSGTQTSGVPVLTVAAGYYPLAQVSFLAACGASFCRVRVNPTNGDVELQDAAPNNTQLNFLIQYPTR